VGNSDSNLLLEAQVGGLLVKEKSDGAVGHKTPVLHSTGIEIGDGQVIQLGQGVRSSKDLGKVLKNLGGDLESEAALLAQAGESVNTANNGLLQLGGGGLDVLELTNSPGNEVGGHDGSLLKDNSLLLRLDLGDLGNGHVGESNQLGGNNQGDSVGGLGSRLIPAGESAAGISGLELGDTHILGVTLSILVRGTVETSHLVAQDTIVVDMQDSGSLGELVLEGEGGGVAVIIKSGLDRVMTIKKRGDTVVW